MNPIPALMNLHLITLSTLRSIVSETIERSFLTLLRVANTSGMYQYSENALSIP